MTFQITKHNLEHVLSAYAHWQQPKLLSVPYDREGNEVEIMAPKREEIQDALNKYDIAQQMNRWHPGLSYGRKLFDIVVVHNDPNRQIRFERISPGLAIIHFDTEYKIKKEFDSATGFERLFLYNTSIWEEPGILRREYTPTMRAQVTQRVQEATTPLTIAFKDAVQPRLRRKYRG